MCCVPDLLISVCISEVNYADQNAHIKNKSLQFQGSFPLTYIQIFLSVTRLYEDRYYN